MSYPHQWWNSPFDPYKDDRIYLSDGSTTQSWAFTGDPGMIIPYEEWVKIPQPEYVVKPLPFVMSNASERASQVMDRYNDRQIHFGK